MSTVSQAFLTPIIQDQNSIRYTVSHRVGGLITISGKLFDRGQNLHFMVKRRRFATIRSGYTRLCLLSHKECAKSTVKARFSVVYASLPLFSKNSPIVLKL